MVYLVGTWRSWGGTPGTLNPLPELLSVCLTVLNQCSVELKAGDRMISWHSAPEGPGRSRPPPERVPSLLRLRTSLGNT